VLNHAETGGTGRHYDHHEYADEKLVALEAWGVEVCRLNDVGKAVVMKN
jgi:hypothetical protein